MSVIDNQAYGARETEERVPPAPDRGDIPTPSPKFDMAAISAVLNPPRDAAYWAAMTGEKAARIRKDEMEYIQACAAHDPNDAGESPDGHPGNSASIENGKARFGAAWRVIHALPKPKGENLRRVCSAVFNQGGDRAMELLKEQWPEDTAGEYEAIFNNRSADTLIDADYYARLRVWQAPAREADAAPGKVAQKHQHAGASGGCLQQDSATISPEQDDEDDEFAGLTKEQIRNRIGAAVRPPPLLQSIDRFFYDGRRYHLDIDGTYVPVDASSATRHLRRWGYIPNDVAAALCSIQTDQYVHYTGPLAGHPRGLHEVSGRKLLITEAPTIIPAAAGDWSTLRAVIHGLLVEPVQIDTFYGWLKVARESLLLNHHRPGQVLGLAGPQNCGKTLILDVLKLALGGRSANPYQYFTGGTTFNEDLAGAELLCVDDEAGSTDIRSRKALLYNIKSNLFAGSVRIHPKGFKAFSCRPWWRMVMTMNDQPEDLLVLPPMGGEDRDKVSLLKCHKFELPMPAYTDTEKAVFFARLKADLPGMFAFLEAWEIPVELRDQRCGVKAYHHPELMRDIHELSPEAQLMNLVDTLVEHGRLVLPWEGTAEDLKMELLDTPLTGRDAEKLLGHWAAATGTYLRKLVGKRVERTRQNERGIQKWRILLPGAQPEQVRRRD